MSADVKLPAIFSNGMVLQEDAKIPVWGWADPGEKVAVTLGTATQSTAADAKGAWRVEFPALPTTTTPLTMTVTGKNTLKFDDILVGDVWLASGQSNMAFAIGWELGEPDWLKANGEGNIMQTTNPRIRFFYVYGRPAVRPGKFGEGRWMSMSPKTAANFSAVAYFFAEQLQKKLNRPIGIIQSAWGGTPIESWASREALQGIPGKQAGLDVTAKEAAALPEDEAGKAAMLEDFRKRDQAWGETVQKPFQALHDQWVKDSAAAKAAGKPIPPQPRISQPRPKSPNGNERDYSALFNGMIAPFIPYPIKGALWYQGEANGPDQYDTMLSHMVTDWRKRWGYDFPFLVVMLANIGERWPTPTDNGWSGVRDAEERVSLDLPKMGTAEAIDIGTANNIHPYDKIDLAKRLAAQALRIAYGQKIVSTGPRFAGMKVEGNKIRVTYQDIGSGLMLAVSPFVSTTPPNENPALPTDAPLSFDIAGADKTWVVAQAKLDGNDVLVWSDQVANPVAVRYGW
jgi:sialate O-acetylesterase